MITFPSMKLNKSWYISDQKIRLPGESPVSELSLNAVHIEGDPVKVQALIQPGSDLGGVVNDQKKLLLCNALSNTVPGWCRTRLRAARGWRDIWCGACWDNTLLWIKQIREDLHELVSMTDARLCYVCLLWLVGEESMEGTLVRWGVLKWVPAQ